MPEALVDEYSRHHLAIQIEKSTYFTMNSVFRCDITGTN